MPVDYSDVVTQVAFHSHNTAQRTQHSFSLTHTVIIRCVTSHRTSSAQTARSHINLPLRILCYHSLQPPLTAHHCPHFPLHSYHSIGSQQSCMRDRKHHRIIAQCSSSDAQHHWMLHWVIATSLATVIVNHILITTFANVYLAFYIIIYNINICVASILVRSKLAFFGSQHMHKSFAPRSERLWIFDHFILWVLVGLGANNYLDRLIGSIVLVVLW